MFSFGTLFRLFFRLGKFPKFKSYAQEIKDAVTRDGVWELCEEWRISTETKSLVKRTGEDTPYRRFYVRVECDYVMEAYCPTLERAIEMAEIFRNLVPRLYDEFGWPSWATRSRLEP